MKKITIEINKFDKNKLFNLFNGFESISIFKSSKGQIIDFIIKESNFDNKTLQKIKINFKSIQVTNLKNKNWISKDSKNDQCVISNLFVISQGLAKFKQKKKFKLIIPASNAFGTGTHASTFLAIQSIEYLIKKKKFYSILDLGTGSGILAFIIKKITKKKVIATDIDINSKKCFLRNMKINQLNNIIFYKYNGFNGKEIGKRKFDLIISNMLLNEHKKLLKYFIFRLSPSGLIIISGILVSQANQIINSFAKFNLILKKKFYCEEWVSLIFLKKGLLYD